MLSNICQIIKYYIGWHWAQLALLYIKVKIGKSQGPAAFYKGFVPNFGRLGSWNVIMFLTLEQVFCDAQWCVTGAASQILNFIESLIWFLFIPLAGEKILHNRSALLIGLLMHKLMVEGPSILSPDLVAASTITRQLLIPFNFDDSLAAFLSNAFSIFGRIVIRGGPSQWWPWEKNLTSIKGKIIG